MRFRSSFPLIVLLGLAACGGSDDPAGAASSTTVAPVSETTVDVTDTTTTPPAASTSTSTSTTLAVTVGGGSDTTSPGTTSTTPPTTTPATPPTTTPATTSPNATPTTTPITTPDSSGCLPGNWIIDEADMNGFYDVVGSASDSPLAIHVTGYVALNLTENTYEYLPAFSLVLGDNLGEGDASGSITGSYVAEDGVITTSLEVPNLVLDIRVGGSSIDGSSLGNNILSSAPINGATYHCEGTTPVIDFQTGAGNPTYPVTLRPA